MVRYVKIRDEVVFNGFLAAACPVAEVRGKIRSEYVLEFWEGKLRWREWEGYCWSFPSEFEVSETEYRQARYLTARKVFFKAVKYGTDDEINQAERMLALEIKWLWDNPSSADDNFIRCLREATDVPVF